MVTLFLGASASLLTPLASVQATSSSLHLTPIVGPPTAWVQVSGAGFASGETVDVAFASALLASAPADPYGSFSTRIQVPAAASPGEQIVSAVGVQSGTMMMTPFTVHTDWAKFGFDLANTGVNPYENVLSTSTVGGLTLKWSKDLGDIVGAGLTPAVGVRRVFVGTVGNGFLDGKIMALDRATGATAWTRDLEVDSSITLSRNVLYFGDALDDRVYALRRSDGSTLWSFQTNGGVFSSPTVVANTVYVGSDDRRLYALNAHTGAQRWSKQFAAAVGSSPAVVNGVVYFPTTLAGTIHALNAKTGAAIWSRNLHDGPIYSSVVVSNGALLYVVTQGLCQCDGHAFALDVATGHAVWESADTFGQVGNAAPAVIGNSLYFGSQTDFVEALDAATGVRLWQTGADSAIPTSTVFANGLLYEGSADGTLYAIDATTGAILWTGRAGGLVSSVVVTDGVLYASAFDDHQYAFALPGSTLRSR